MKRKIGFALVLAAAAMSVGAAGDRSLRARLRAVLGGGKAVASDVLVQAAQETFRSVSVVNSAGIEVAAVEPDDFNDGVVGVADRTGGPKAGMLVADDLAGLVAVSNTAGEVSYMLHGNSGLLAASADMAEEFTAVSPEIPAGTVVVIDSENRGALRPSSQAYDRRVAGVVAGANDYKPGITLGALSGQPNRVPVTLSGTVYCRVTGVVRAGDLLTTAALPGHAMRVADNQAAQGAILGKAMESFDGESGLILVLASLQ